MNYLNNYYNIKVNLYNLNNYNLDYIENYLLEYFNTDTLYSLFDNKYHYFINKSTNDLYLRYKNLFKTIFNYDLKSSLSSGALKLEKIKNNDYKINFVEYNNFHPKDIYQLNLWFYLNNFINTSIIYNLKNSERYLLIKNKLTNNIELLNDENFYYSEIDYFNWFERNIKLTFDILSGLMYLVVPYSISLKLNKKVNIKIESIFDKNISDIVYSTSFLFKSGDLILFLDNIEKDNIISLIKIV